MDGSLIPSCIYPNVYLGSIFDLYVHTDIFQTSNLKYILRCCNQPEIGDDIISLSNHLIKTGYSNSIKNFLKMNYNNQLKIFYFYSEDTEYFDMLKNIQSAKNFYTESMNNNDGSLFICCDGGINRSAFLTCIFLMDKGFSATDAINHVKKIRGLALTNEHFINLLHKYNL